MRNFAFLAVKLKEFSEEHHHHQRRNLNKYVAQPNKPSAEEISGILPNSKSSLHHRGTNFRASNVNALKDGAHKEYLL
ncbi:hypothetical protein C7N43_05460 [Sphingobacteriales bacterium UPWRP_1]|nr:hypothetical protein BVG80_06335 [Sphingobacteriales bacterium TSM_CSM]PSJ78026.1 hypothetical protein C7N43_05460 [Sphingobacteriales bacterium UPWRP_1]